MLGVGIDFGTSNCSVALYDGDSLRYATLEPERAAPEVMPSALYLARDLSFEVGRDAIESYVQDNAGRSVRMTSESVGEITVTVAGTESTGGSDDGAITETFPVHALTDEELPGRLFRGVKRWLGNGSVDRVRVFDARYRIVALATPIMATLSHAAVREASAAGKGRSAPTFVGRPVHYPVPVSQSARGSARKPRTGEPETDRVAVGRMREICRNAGLARAELYPEPAAAALCFLGARGGQNEEGRTILAFDFGGGTLDLCLMRERGGAFEILATHGVGLGGDEIDRRIFRAALFPELGCGASVPQLSVSSGSVEQIPFPFGDYADRLLNWMQTHELNQADHLAIVARGARQSGLDGERLSRLRELIEGNHVYTVFRAIERAKVELSEKNGTKIDVPAIDLEVDLDREAFERIFEPIRKEAARCIECVLAQANLPPQAVDTVVRTGGSSRIPAVIRLLEERFPSRVVEHDPFTSIAAGLAIASYRALRHAGDRT